MIPRVEVAAPAVAPRKVFLVEFHSRPQKKMKTAMAPNFRRNMGMHPPAKRVPAHPHRKKQTLKIITMNRRRLRPAQPQRLNLHQMETKSMVEWLTLLAKPPLPMICQHILTVFSTNTNKKQVTCLLRRPAIDFFQLGKRKSLG